MCSASGTLFVACLLTTALLLLAAAPALAGEIHQAIAAGDVAKVKTLLKADPALANVPDENDQFASLPLHLAAISGNVEIAALLLDAGASVDCGDSDESTPLDCAAINHHPEMVDFLLSKGADINRRDKNGACAISFATAGGDSTIVKQLMHAGADLNFRNASGYTLLHFATTANTRSLFDLLLSRGGNVDVAAVDGVTPLHLAALRGNMAAVEALLAAGAAHSPRDQHGQTPLFNAVIRNRAEVVHRLVAAGADPNAADTVGNTPIHPATWSGSAEALQALIDHGADVNAVGSSGEVPIFSAVELGNTAILGNLLRAGAKVDVRDPHFGATPLHFAAALGAKGAAEQLLAAGADVSGLDNVGQTPLELAVDYGHRDVAELLITNGAVGALEGIDAGTLAAQRPVSKGEAVVWYLNHGGYAVKTKNHLLVFDYFSRAADPACASLANGHIAPKEIAGENVMVFASHEHQDHFVPAIFEWRREIPEITYVLGCRPDSAPAYEFMGPRETRTIDGVKITTIDSNDPGVGFWVEVDGLVIFHAGDHANRWLDFSGPYKEEIDFLAATGKRPDIAIMPVSGCGFGDPEAVRLGICYALETLKPSVFMPAHAGGAEYRYVDFVAACKDKHPSVQMIAPLARGDRYRYGSGKMTVAASE